MNIKVPPIIFNRDYLYLVADDAQQTDDESGPPGFWGRIGNGFGQLGQSFVRMGKVVWNAVPKVPNIRFTGGSNRSVNEKNGPPPTPEAKSIWVKIDEAAEELMEMASTDQLTHFANL